MSIVMWEVPEFTIDHDLSSLTKTGSTEFLSSGRAIGKVALLYHDDGTPISVANNWLIHLKANLHREEVSTQAQGLLHFFSFLNDIDHSWDFMPGPLRKRPTYAFKRHLKEAFKSGVLARSTANSYMRVVVNFYKFYLSKNYVFDHPPFNYETVKVDTPSRHDFMRKQSLIVESTDVRLGLPSDRRFNGLSRRLIPLSEHEWQLVEEICNNDKKGIVHTTKTKIEVPLSKEFLLALEICRYSGLRREELITLRARQIYKPTSEKLHKKYLIHSEGLTLDPKLGIRTKNGTVRHAEIPVSLMEKLHIYINSERYVRRKKLFEQCNPAEADNPPILITQRGNFYSPKSLDARWGELRNAVRAIAPSFDHKFHNLRSTYAVFRLKELLNRGLKEADALDYLQAVMGHKQRSTLLGYLKLSRQEKSANQVFEESLERLLEG